MQLLIITQERTDALMVDLVLSSIAWKSKIATRRFKILF